MNKAYNPLNTSLMYIKFSFFITRKGENTARREYVACLGNNLQKAIAYVRAICNNNKAKCIVTKNDLDLNKIQYHTLDTLMYQVEKDMKRLGVLDKSNVLVVGLD